MSSGSNSEKLLEKGTSFAYNSGSRFFDIIANAYNYFIRPVLTESIRLIPDSIFAGSILLALITQSYSHGMFALALLEAFLVGQGLRALTNYMDIQHTSAPTSENPAQCYPSAWAPSLETLLDFMTTGTPQSSFPSFPVFFISTAIAYILGGLYTQKQELEALGPDYSSRFYIGLIGSFLLLFAVMVYRLVNNCDGLGIILLSLLFGSVTGLLLLYQNGYMFGRDAVNLTGIPLLKSRTKDGKPLYICTTKGTL